jgi:hypothetical protein
MEYTITCLQNDLDLEAIIFFNIWIRNLHPCNGSAMLHKRGRGNLDD